MKINWLVFASLVLMGTNCAYSVSEVNPSGALTLAGSEDAVVAPYRSLLYTADDIREVRAALQSDSSNRKSMEERHLKAAQWWIDRGREGVDELLPPDGSVYAFGIAGDPKNGKSWPRYGRYNDVCTFERPGQVRSPHTGDIYGNQKPGERYYDDGSGWVDPKTGTRYYFKGMWNCFAVWKMHDAVDDLAIAYMLTGDERCAELGLYMLDWFAGMRRRNPENYGLIDNPHATAPGYGFFGFMGNIANDRMVFSAFSFDLLAGSKYARTSSQGTEGLTVAENIEQHYFDVFEPWQIEKLNSFQNHAVAAYSALLSQALLFGDAQRTELGIDLAYAFFDSCINRDGDYYEMSASYSRLGRGYGGPLFTLLSNYRLDRYDPEARMPDPADYPNTLQFGNNPTWYSVAVETLYRHTVMGRHLQYGDAHPDRDVLPGETSAQLTRERAIYLSLFYRQTTNPQWRESLARRYWSLPNLKSVEIDSKSVVRFGPAAWLEPPAPKSFSGTDSDVSDVMPAKGLAIIRSGEGEHQRAFYMCGGMRNSHAHDDQMALTPYAKGMSLTGEYGYFYYGTPDFCGWGTRSIAHNMVVVNEDLPQPPFLNIAPWKRIPPSNITAFARRKPAQLVEMNHPGMWDGVADNMQDYRRTAWLIDLSPEAFYFVDIFQVVGGTVHDYAWHSPYLEPPQTDDGFSVSGVSLRPKNGVWVLAAQDNDTVRDASYNKPGQSWGERLLGRSGRIKELGIPGEKIGYSKWNPPPGNGYGFIYNLRSAQTTDDWTAQWLLHDKKHSQRLHFLNYDGMTAVAGQEPILEGDSRQSVVIARRIQPETVSTPLHSRFVTVNEVDGQGRFALRNVQRIATTGSTAEQDRVALNVESQDGIRDTILVNRQGGRSETSNGVTLDGYRAFVRKDASGFVSDMLLQEGTLLTSGGITIEADAPAWEARVTAVDFDENGFSIKLDRLLPEGERLRGAMALFLNPDYSHNNYYEIERVENNRNSSRLIFSKQRLAMAYLQVKSVDLAEHTITTRFPCELVSLPEMNYFNGHCAMVVSGEKKICSSRVVEFEGKKTVVLEDASEFKAGDRVAVIAVQKGDLLCIPSQITLNRTAPGQYELYSTHDVTVTLPGQAPVEVKLEDLPTGSMTLTQDL